MAKHLAKPVFSLICEEVALYHKLYSIVLYNFIQHCDLLTMGFRNRSRPEPEYLAGAVTYGSWSHPKTGRLRNPAADNTHVGL